MTFSLVVPVYGNQDTLAPLVERLGDLATQLPDDLEVVFVVDGSPDGSLLILRRLLPTAGFASQLITHSRNFGSFAAVRTGFAAANGDHVACMAADLQEPIDLIAQFHELLRDGDYDVVVGTRSHRDDPWLARMLSNTFWSFYRRWISADIPRGGVDVFACTSQVAHELLKLDESRSSLIGLLYWLGFRRAEVPYRRGERSSGRSSWSWRKRFEYMLDSVFSFTALPIAFLMLFGTAGALVTLVVSAAVLVARLTGQISETGYTPIMLVVLLSTFMVLTAIGIVGAYVWRTYENSKGRPAAIAMTHERFAAPQQPEA